MKRNMHQYTQATGIGFVNAAQIMRPGMVVIVLSRNGPAMPPPGIDLMEATARWGEFGFVQSRTDDTVDVRMVSRSGKPTGETRRVTIHEILATFSGRENQP
jgi:hypothetical protein